MQKLFLLAVVGLVGCAQAQASSPKKPKAAPKASASAHTAAHEPKHGHAAHEASSPGSARKFMVPFTWEAKADDPLARTRLFMREAMDDNRQHTKQHGTAFFERVREAEHPRATLLTCSDSRVQHGAFDRTPEDDVFTIRNLGNQVATSEGSVEYGVQHLKTPVLMVLGHTRCGAVKAAMGDFSREGPALAKELESLAVPKSKTPPEAAAWLAAVKDNVSDQVARALRQFGSEVEQGNLTVVGAVYDLAGDMGAGPGRLHIVDINGNTDAPRIEAFTRAVQGLPPAAAPKVAGPETPAKRRASGTQVLSVRDLDGLRALKADGPTPGVTPTDPTRALAIAPAHH
ncbi:MAG TPA: carbonic anhydrase [Polyangiaceae bacterium]